MSKVILIIFCFLLLEGHAQEVFYKKEILHTVHVGFKSDESFVAEKNKILIDSLVDLSQSIDSIAISLIAHTDDQGSNEYNLKLSKKRANQVKNYLIEKNIQPHLITLNPKGETRPIADNKTASGMATNRRVEILVYRFKKLQWIKGVVKNDSSQVIHKALVKLHSKSHTDSSYTDVQGQFKLSAPIKEVIGLDIVAADHMPTMNQMMRLSPKVVSTPIEIKLESIVIGKKFEVRRLNFVGNKAILVEKSIPILPFLKEFMIMNSGTCIQIIGHINQPNTPDVDRDSREFELSIARAKTINDYLYNKTKIAQNRMMYEGRGNSEMLFPKTNDEQEMAQNRRVMIMIANCNETKEAIPDTLSGRFDFWQ